MRIAETFWKDFRNLKPRRLVWRAGLNVLSGENGAGKTNMLEALNILCGWGSFESKTRELVSWSAAFKNSQIEGKIEGEENFLTEILISSRTFAKLDKDRISCSELRARVPSLCFLPRDMNIIGGSPATRRSFLDKLCALLSVPYAKRISDYRRLLRHRIKLLRTGKPPDITSPLLASIGSWIWSVRGAAVNLLCENFTGSALFPVAMKIEMKNEMLCKKDEFLNALEVNYKRELHAKVPLTGPHRDDLLIRARVGENWRDASQVLSRGQRRRATLALLIAGGRVIEKKMRRAPIFLIDELSSELDAHARKIVENALLETNWQIFATSAEWSGESIGIREGEPLGDYI